MESDHELVLKAATEGDVEILQCLGDDDLQLYHKALIELYDEYYFDLSRPDRNKALDKLTVQVAAMEAEQKKRRTAPPPVK